MNWYLWLLLFLPCALFSAWASGKVNSTYRAFRGVANRSHMTGYDTAIVLLRREGISGIRVGKVSGTLSDHYNPSKALVNLSDATYGDASVGSVAVAAHEIGHVVQRARGYFPYKLRTALVPITNIGSRLALPLALLGVILDLAATTPIGMYFAYAGIALYGLSTLFQLVTLPVEFDASRRANKMLVEAGILAEDEIGGAKKVLTAAALTYVAALLTSLLYFLRFMLIILSMVGRRRR